MTIETKYYDRPVDENGNPIYRDKVLYKGDYRQDSEKVEDKNMADEWLKNNKPKVYNQKGELENG